MSLSPNTANEAKTTKMVSFEYESPLEIETDERASLEIETDERASLEIETGEPEAVDSPEIVYSVNSQGQEMPPDENRSCGGRFYNAFAGFLFPRITPIPSMAFIVLSLVAALP